MKRSFIKAFCFALLASSLLSTVKAASEPISASTTRSSLRVVGNTLYFLNAPPDKIKPRQFKDQKAINTHYTALLAAIKKRNAVQDARSAFKQGMRYFFTSNGRTAAQNQRGNPLGLNTPEMAKLCPRAVSTLKWLEGYKFGENYGECLSNSSSACRNYIFYVEAYILPWNKEMSRLCKGGK
ncbi:MAG: hypothetical protein WAQ53_18880 [Thiofilum sp.]|uniref:hypothetical protein n=1 Tax=Thiofilum sp. TaxID=2212733 RepID=UPI0025DE3564|nr:hypothetical protein [Thiofilum sp.]MBK8454458.1 hypothetical protein [Thiofilum sp.]